MFAAGMFPPGVAHESWRVPLAGLVVVAVLGSVALLAWRLKSKIDSGSGVLSYATFIYASFLKPHSSPGDGDQKTALESFYKVQVFNNKLAGYDFGVH